MSDVEYVANEIILMKEGKFFYTGTSDEIILSMDMFVWNCIIPKSELNNYMKNRKRRKCWKIKMPLFILLSFGIDKI